MLQRLDMILALLLRPEDDTYRADFIKTNPARRAPETACFNQPSGNRQGQSAERTQNTAEMGQLIAGTCRRLARWAQTKGKKKHNSHHDSTGQEGPIPAERTEREATPGRAGDARQR